MATINSRATIDLIITHNGWADPADADIDPPAVKIVQYTNAWGRVTWGVVFEGDGDPDRYERPTQYVTDPRVIWRR